MEGCPISTTHKHLQTYSSLELMVLVVYTV